MKSFKLDRWFRQISQTEEEELSCSDCFDLIDQYVDAQVAGARLTEKLVRVRQHLYECKVCQEEYETLHDLALLERQGHAPSIDDLMKSL